MTKQFFVIFYGNFVFGVVMMQCDNFFLKLNRISCQYYEFYSNFSGDNYDLHAFRVIFDILHGIIYK